MRPGVPKHRGADLGDVLKRKEVDAVIIATPSKLHAQAIAEAARAGKHIFCEKPMALTLAEADLIGILANLSHVACPP